MDPGHAKELVRALGVRADLQGLDTLTDEERTVLLPDWARGVIGNGGFRYFYEGRHDLLDVARRLRALGLDAAADSCQRVARQVSAGGPLPADEGEREVILGQVDWRRFDSEEQVVCDLGWPELRAAIARYVDAHPSAFQQALQAARR